MMEVKGAVLMSMKSQIPKLQGRDGFDRWLDRLDMDVAKIFKINVSSSAWYPLEEYLVKPTEIYCDLFHGGDMKGAWELGRQGAEYSLHGMYKIFVQLGSVSFIINRAVKILPAFFKPSALEVVETSGNSCILHITEFPGINKVMEYRIAGWIEGALDIHGCKNINLDIPMSMGDGQQYTEYIITWD